MERKSNQHADVDDEDVQGHSVVPFGVAPLDLEDEVQKLEQPLGKGRGEDDEGNRQA